MKYCNKCGITLGGNLDKCALCHAELTGEAEPSVFPRNEAKKSGTLALNVFAFATGASILIMVFLWLLPLIPGDITLVVCLGLVLNYIFVRNALVHRPDFLRVIVRYFLVLLAIAVVWFLLTQNLVVTTYVIPGICLVALIFDTVLIGVFKGTFVSTYAKYLLFDALFALAPLVLVAFNLTTSNILAYISALAAGVFLLWIFVFMRKDILAEIRKLFSM